MGIRVAFESPGPGGVAGATGCAESGVAEFGTVAAGAVSAGAVVWVAFGIAALDGAASGGFC